MKACGCYRFKFICFCTIWFSEGINHRTKSLVNFLFSFVSALNCFPVCNCARPLESKLSFQTDMQTWNVRKGRREISRKFSNNIVFFFVLFFYFALLSNRWVGSLFSVFIRFINNNLKNLLLHRQNNKLFRLLSFIIIISLENWLLCLYV